MILIPAIDIRGGKVVRLLKGDYAREKIYSESPLDYASLWQNQGAGCIHLVDLDAAKEGRLVNFEKIREIRRGVSVALEYGGGIRTMDDAAKILDLGIERLIVGTSALDASFLKKLLTQYGPRIAVGVDQQDGFVKTAGWIENSKVMYLDFCRRLENDGVKTIIFTDISRDGMLQGPNLAALSQVLEATKMQVIASGGVSKTEDLLSLQALQKKNLYGVIVGKALYEGAIDLKQALEKMQQAS